MSQLKSQATSNASHYDYVIVGAGSAGCVLAHRLSEDPKVSVLLLESGGRDPFWEWRIRMPAALAYPMNSTTYNWDYRSEPEPHLNGRVMHCPRGKVLGGSSSINGMVYIRGNALDYDRWAKEDVALADWDYQHCLPYFKKAETREGGGDDYHGNQGPLHVTRGQIKGPLHAAFVEAGQQAGYPYTKDLNGFQQEGFGPMDRTTKKGTRHSTSLAYLNAAKKRSNLHILTRAEAQTLILENKVARGVVYKAKGAVHSAMAAKEVILCGGPINSPKLLMHSGIGPAHHLQEHGIKPVHNLPGVGKNLQDHLEIYIQMACTQPVSIYRFYNLWGKALVGAQWLLSGTGVGASNQFETGGFIRSRVGIEHPDLQYHFFPMAVRYDGQSPNNSHGFQAHVGPMRSQSKGEVTLKSADVNSAPRIAFNYMSSAEDWQGFRDAIRLTREIFAQSAFEPYRGEELSPGAHLNSDAELDAFILNAVESAYHPSGTCKMGSDGMAVVDGEGRVHGVAQLRVVDSSIMPSIVTGNLNAPTIMMAEKLADSIAGKPPLPPAGVPVFRAENFNASQR